MARCRCGAGPNPRGAQRCDGEGRRRHRHGWECSLALGAGRVRRLRPAQCAARGVAPARARGRLDRGWRLSLPARRRGADGGERVVTGAKIGLRANGGKEIANRNLRAALVTGWYGAATTELPRQRGRLKPTWAPKGAIRCRIAIIAMSCGQTPRPRHDGPLRTGGGLAQPKRQGGCRADSCGHAATGEPPGSHEASEPWRVALQAGPGTISGRADVAQRWQARRAETVLAAAVGQPTRRSRRLGRQRKASQGTLAALLRLRPSRVARDGSPITT